MKIKKGIALVMANAEYIQQHKLPACKKDWKEPDNVRRQIVAIPEMVAKDEKYQNAMKNSDKQNACMESERALQQVIFSVMADNMELFKQFQDNPSFKKWLSDMVFNMTYEPKK